MPVTITILHFTRRLLLLVFGSRPSDQTEGTFDGIGNATNMAVIPQGLSIFMKMQYWFEPFWHENHHIMVNAFEVKETYENFLGFETVWLDIQIPHPL